MAFIRRRAGGSGVADVIATRRCSDGRTGISRRRIGCLVVFTLFTLARAVAASLARTTLLGREPRHSRSARKAAAAENVALDVFGLDGRVELVKATREFPVAGVAGDALALPFASRAFDFVIASQVLHHFPFEDAVQLVRRCIGWQNDEW
jgi:hypothetical protein